MRRYIIDLIRRIMGTKELIRVSNDLTQFSLYELRRFLLIDHILHDTEKGINTERYTDHEIIVSLTTHGKRIYDVAFTIESIMQQSMKANRIVLWLDHCFKGKRLPQFLMRQQERGLEIAFCTDMGSFTKLVPALCRFPDAAIITIDDDALYDSDLLERLIIPYLEDPRYIYCHRCHKITLNIKGEVLPYKQWHWNCHEVKLSHLNFATGIGGVLYPPHSLDEEVKNEKVFMDICNYADDVWFKAMAIKKGTFIKKVNSRNEKGEDYLLNQSVQDIGLFKNNFGGGHLNDKQFKDVFDKYNLYSKLQ